MEAIRLSTDDSVEDALYDEAFQSMKVTELKQELKARNLPQSGTKAELVNRLIEATSSSKDALLETDADANEDEILDDDLSSDSPTKELALFAEEKLTPEAPLPETKAARKRTAITMGNGQEKKLCLNRATPIVFPPPSTEDNIAVPKKATVNTGDSTTKKIVFSDKSLTAHEKLAHRAERFSIKSSGTIKLKVTDKGSENLPSPDVKTTSFKPITFGSAPNLDRLKKRAERFGVVSSVLQKVEEKNKAKLRLARFGGSSMTSTNDESQRPVVLQLAKRASKFNFISPGLQQKLDEKKVEIRRKRFACSVPMSFPKKTLKLPVKKIWNYEV